MIIKIASDPDFEAFANKERAPGIEHGWSLMDLLSDGQLEHLLSEFSNYGTREEAQEVVDRLNGLDHDDREHAGLQGAAVLTYYSYEDE
jgi:hypothetical protein